MLVKNQLVEVKWSNKMRKYYESLGYKFTQYGDTFLVLPEQLPKTSKALVDVECDYCSAIFKQTNEDYNGSISKSVQKSACKNCINLKKAEGINKMNEPLHEQYYKEYLDECARRDYTPLSSSCNNLEQDLLEYVCNIHGVQRHNLKYLKEYGCSGCKKDANLLDHKVKKINEFEEECIKRGYTSLATVDDYKDCYSPLPFICPKHGEKEQSLIKMQINHEGCDECGNEYRASKLRLSQDEVKDLIESKNNNKWLNYGEYISSITNNLIIECGTCSKPFKCSANNYSKNETGRCPDCNERSIGEYKIAEMLDMYNIQYTRQEHFDGDCRDVKPMPFDFYLPAYDLCIEFDGPHHYRPVWGEEYFKKTLLHDAMKDNYCRWNNIKLLRIPYWEINNIEKIIKDKLCLTRSDISQQQFPKILYTPRAYRELQKSA